MPPKPKFTKEEIIDAALTLVSERGIEALTSRDLGSMLGSSARPIFTVFRNMEEVQQEVRNAAMKRFDLYAERALQYTPAFKQLGMQMILFAKEEPKLFQLLFMSENMEIRSFDDISEVLGEMATLCMDVIIRDYGLTLQEAKQMFRNLWILTYGISVLFATRMCDFSEEEVHEILGQDFMGMILLINSGGLNLPAVKPLLKNADV